LVDYEEIEEKCKTIRQNNIKLLEDFDAWLKVKRLTDQTIREHMNNIDLFINHFLLYEDAYEAKDGVLESGVGKGVISLKIHQMSKRSLERISIIV